MPQISLVIVTHQSAAWLASLAHSWQVSAAAAGMADAPVVIVDADSSDDTLPLAEKYFGGALLLRESNRGFGALANTALRAVETDWTLLCNADVSFAPEFAQQTIEAAAGAEGQIACIVPQLLNPNGTVQPSMGGFPSLRGMVGDQWRPRLRRKYVFPQPRAGQTIDWASGACLLLRREAFLAVGGFDEKYFLYMEEVDLQRRLHGAGWKIWFEPKMQVIHHLPNAARPPRPEIQRYAARGMLRYFAKFGSSGSLAAYRALALVSGRLPPGEAFASRREILQRTTGP